MKFVRYGSHGSEKPGIVDDKGAVRSLAGIVDDIDGNMLSESSLDRLRAIDTNLLPLVEQDDRLGPCITGVGKIICIGLNYSDHAAESGMDVPDEPVIFFKATSAISGPYDDVLIPRNSEKTDWEVELGVVIGTRADGEEVRAPHDGYIVFPNALAEANYEWFYLAEATRRFNP